VCPNDLQHSAEFAAEVTSGNLVFCLTGNCNSPTLCCFEALKPGNLCVTK
jgi:hypothetical protein